MFTALKKKIAINTDSSELLKKFDIDIISAEAQKGFEGIFQALKEPEKQEVAKWFEDVKAIRLANDLTLTEKEQRISDLPTSEVLLNFIKAVFRQMADILPVENKSVAKALIGAVGVATSLLNFELAGLTLVALQVALPKILLSEGAGNFVDYILRLSKSPSQVAI